MNKRRVDHVEREGIVARQGEKPQKWWLTLLVAILPSLIAGWFSLQAINKANASAAAADKTSSELTVAYDLMKQAMAVVQHEADADREALQKNNDLLVKLLEQHKSHSAQEREWLSDARALNGKLLDPTTLKRPDLPPSLHQLLDQPQK
jgi:hypothetical protein